MHNERKFIDCAVLAGERILSEERLLLVHHFDVDGITSGSIAALALNEKGVRFDAVSPKRMGPEVIERVRQHPSKTVVVTDLGAGFLQELAETGKKVFVLDHHPPEIGSNKNIEIVNPHSFGFDGSYEGCGATVAYFAFSRHVRKETAKRMAELGIVGAVGDVQSTDGMKGLNSVMLAEAEECRAVTRKKDLRLFGRVSRSLVGFLCYSSEPVLPGLTGNEKKCALFLQQNGLKPFSEENGSRKWLHYYDLPEVKRKALAGALAEHCISHGVEDAAVRQMVGDVYLLNSEKPGSELFDAFEFATLLNACGRNGRADLGVRVCTGAQGAFEEALLFLKEHRKAISKGIAFAKASAEDFGAFHFLDARGAIPDSIIGSVAGAHFSSGSFRQDKPIIALSVDADSGKVKASARASRALVDKGLDLGSMMREAASGAGGYGGGHSAAAGCTIDDSQQSISAFLLGCKDSIETQLKNTKQQAARAL